VSGALDGLRVVELASGITGPYATKLLVDLGAEVTKIEPPQGDSLREWGPFPGGVKDRDRSGLFEYLNAGKRGATLDLSCEGELAEARRLVGAADLLIECGSGVSQLDVGQPGLVVVRISNFGQQGPLRNRQATPLTMQAASGWISKRDPCRPPVQAGARISEYVAGAYAALGALTALRCRSESPTESIQVDVSILEALLSTLPYPMLAVQKMRTLGIVPTGRGGPMLGVVRVSDGWVGINCLTGQHWLDVCAMVGLPQFGEHQLAVMHGAPERAEFFDKVQQWLDMQTVTGIVELSQAMRIPAAPVSDGASAVTCPQYVARSSFIEAGGDGWSFRRPGAPYRLSKTPVRSPRPAPRLGSAESLESRDATIESDAPPSAPFDGLTVLDLSTFWAGAYLTCYLGAFGADVIKVESIQRPDGFRYSGAFPTEGDDWYERSVMWQATNLNKRDVTLNLTTESGRELVRELVARADVVVENFSPRVVEHFGLDYDSVVAIKPDVIMVRMPGFGLEGPWRDYVGWALNIEQMSGMSAATGYPDGPPTDLQGPADPIVGVHATIALLAALEHRRRSGEGQLIEVAQIEVGAALVAEPVIECSMNGEVPPRVGNRQRGYLQGVYPTADEAWVALSVRDDADWAQLVDAMADPELLGEERFSSHDAFDEVVSEWTRARPVAAVVDALSTRGVPVERVMTPDRMYDVEQLDVRGFYEALEHPLSGLLRFPGWPFRMTPGPVRHHRWAAPLLGQHNDAVLGELGVSDEQIATLREEGVIGEAALGA